MAAKKKTTRNKNSGGFVYSRTNIARFFTKPSRILIAVLAFANVGVALILFAQAASLVTSFEAPHSVQVNNWRSAHGKASLKRSKCLTNIARAWSQSMASKGAISHSSIPSYYANFCPNVYSVSWGENVASYAGGALNTEQLANQFFTMWKNSPGHNTNMLSSTWTYAGYGLVHVERNGTHYYYGTQIFANCYHVCTGEYTSSPDTGNIGFFTGLAVAKKTNNGNNGYWTVTTGGRVDGHGDVSTYGGMYGKTTNGNIVAMAAPSFGKGYWIVTDKGKVYKFGSAGHFGDASGKALNKPIVGMAGTKDGKGYWLVASDGGIFSYGNAKFYGSMGGKRLNKPIVGMAANPLGGGYWLVASDGGIFTFGSSKFYGSMGGKKLNSPVVAMSAHPSGKGYVMLGADGGVFTFGSMKFYGSAAGKLSGEFAMDIGVKNSGKGYWIITTKNRKFSFGL